MNEIYATLDHVTPTTVISNVDIVTEHSIIENGSLVVEQGRITEISPNKTASGDITIDGRGAYLLPGFIDIHGDSLENAIAPRPAAPFPMEYALPAFDAELTVHGITTMYYCVAMADLGETLTKPLRKRETVLENINAVNAFRNRARVRSNIHLRYEILDMDSLPLIQELIADNAVDLLSIMDHTPGFGVFGSIEDYREYRKRSGGSLEKVDREIEERFRLREKVDLQAIAGLIGSCHDQGIKTASHDDHTAEKVRQAKDLGINIAEFPVSEEAARAACELDMRTVFGAANLVRNQSHAGNVLASDMIQKDLCHIICSDYSPMCMLQGLFTMKKASRLPFPELVSIFSLNPARATGMDNLTGSIKEGKLADLILVRNDLPVPQVRATFVEGNAVFTGNGFSCAVVA